MDPDANLPMRRSNLGVLSSCLLIEGILFFAGVEGGNRRDDD